MMRVSFTRTGHVLHPLGSPDDNYLICIAKIQSSSLFLVTDANLKRMFLYDARRPYAPAQDELMGYHRNDLSIASVDLLDPGDGEDAICGDICVDDSGHYIYALIIKQGSAYVKLFQNLDRVLTYQKQRIELPKSDLPYEILRETVAPLKTLPLHRCLGRPIIDSPYCYGTGMAYFNGALYVLTRREARIDISTLVRYDVLMHPGRVDLTDEEINPGPFVPGSESLRSDTDEGTSLIHLRMADKRTANVRFSMLTTINAETGLILGDTRLTQPTFGDDVGDDSLLHGLSVYDGKLWVGRRWDINTIPEDITLWHLIEGKSHIPVTAPEYVYSVDESTDEDGNVTYHNGWVSCQIVGFMNYEYAVYADWDEVVPLSSKAVQISDRLLCTSAYAEFMRMAKSQNPGAMERATLMTQSRGPTMITSYNLADLKPDNISVPAFSVVTDVFPFGIAMPYSMTHDQAERKFYCAFGNQAWVFDCLDYTLLANYPDSEELFEGEIIDMGNILESNRQELQCFFRNDATFTMYGVTLTIEVTEDDPRTEDLFMFIPPSTEGFKTITLGDIPPGESREFWTRIFSLNVKSWEDLTTHTLPLRIYYDVTHDDF